MGATAAILTASIVRTTPGTASSPFDLLAPLAAATLARFKLLSAAVERSLVIGVVQQAVFWFFHSGTYSDIVIFLVIVAGLTQPGSSPTRRCLERTWARRTARTSHERRFDFMTCLKPVDGQGSRSARSLEHDSHKAPRSRARAFRTAKYGGMIEYPPSTITSDPVW